jgi:hypothetical protein
MAGKEAAIAYDYTHCHLLCHDSPVSELLMKVDPGAGFDTMLDLVGDPR